MVLKDFEECFSQPKRWQLGSKPIRWWSWSVIGKIPPNIPTTGFTFSGICWILLHPSKQNVVSYSRCRSGSNMLINAQPMWVSPAKVNSEQDVLQQSHAEGLLQHMFEVTVTWNELLCYLLLHSLYVETQTLFSGKLSVIHRQIVQREDGRKHPVLYWDICSITLLVYLSVLHCNINLVYFRGSCNLKSYMSLLF